MTSTKPVGGGLKRRDLLLSGSSLVAASALSAAGLTSPAQAQQPTPAPAAAGQRPNIVFIMGDDIGWFNIGAYHQGIMASRTPKPRQAQLGDKTYKVYLDGYNQMDLIAGKGPSARHEISISPRTH